MSLTKFESLPNEILTDIIEKYINGIDLLRAFSFQLNQRIDSLIIQSQRLHFNFIQCHQDDFCVCMKLLPPYLDKIEELAISEQDTPGQIYTFLSFFQSFTLFKQLRKLYLHLDDRILDWKIFENALYSLLETKINTLSIKATIKENRSSMENIIVCLFDLKSLRSFSFLSNFNDMKWDNLANISSNIEYLTLSGIYCELQDLQYIFKCASHLKYLDVEIADWQMRFYSEKEKRSKTIILVMSKLRKLVLNFAENSLVTIDMLTEYLNLMPALKYLEIKAHRKLLDANRWMLMLETSLPLLNHFILRTVLSLTNNRMTVWLDQAAFEDPYWQTFIKQPSQSTISSSRLTIFNRRVTTNTSDTSTKKKSIFSYLNFFKK
ncbi:unnamed protein product [Rotaria sordida]|uniref:F-box domain-containing protein n=1 Tax=Rotaria sordida TaxID=392033 RepID=A0A816BYJ3_9BILA|nr:unnamed protein product [Rotaria sordida]CAF1614582.1 unnamed protein product [Rotaria sordida]